MKIHHKDQWISFVLVLAAMVWCLPSSISLPEENTKGSSQITTLAISEQTQSNQAESIFVPFILKSAEPRGYLTTPRELATIRDKANRGIEPYRSAVKSVLKIADENWSYTPEALVTCPGSKDPTWISNEGGIRILYAKALAYSLTGLTDYADQVKNILQIIMTEAQTISKEDQQCMLNFAWGTPELVASADLIETYWGTKTCTGPISTIYGDSQTRTGRCKFLFQNWLIKNPYYIISLSAELSKSNWGAAATTTLAYIADYLWDRPNAALVHRNPPEINNGQDVILTPGEAYAHANKLALDRMNGYGVEYGSSSSCDYLSSSQQNEQWLPVKSQITQNGVIPEDARREEYCNIPQYNGQYENYPQLHLGQNIQQCELMLRRGDRSCYDNVDKRDITYYAFKDPDGNTKETHLYPGRGSIERAIKAIIVDSRTEWKHDSALEVAYRYYFNHHTLPGFEYWNKQIDHSNSCSQDICFGTLTHGFSPGEIPGLPPVVPPPHP